MRFTSIAAAALAALVLSACAAPAPLRGEFAQLTPQQAVQGRSGDAAVAPTRVRWGGTILSMKNSQQESCFEILSRPLSYSARPLDGDRDEGRFLACYKGFKDPEVFKPGREVTVVGTLTGFETRKVEDFSYTYPQVAADDIYLWQERRDPPTDVVDPFFYPYPYYYPVYYYYPAPRPAPRRSVAPDLAPPMPAPPQPLGGLLGG